MLKTSIQVLTPDDWLADEKYVNFQEDALSSSQFQIMDIKILASSHANFYFVLVFQLQASEKETHLSIQIPAVVEGELVFSDSSQTVYQACFCVGFCNHLDLAFLV
jgi:hypothetical protein